ncbi:class I SAM-dependent methyltransferase [Ochrobactrum tritici]|uniref:Class I SAM-dependent methyltransferase n=1 Tax=Brucella tritici TaxID=94626 RepID=A0A7X6FPM0_9HYPH|nr:class I SAM-dependent methyltransferase [Brucella tritici]
MGINDEIIVSAENKVKHELDMGAKSFSKLKIEKRPDIRDVDVFNAFSSMFWKIEKYVPSAWGEHIPFLFSLISFLKPRRFVELGVHNGGSFLAACQAVDYGNIACECVGVDNWIGERQAGFHSSEVFNSFLNNLSRYSDFAGYIRSNFHQAAEQFEDGSIDLLHIDGFHSEEAVQNDFDTWLPKMSDIGVIIFMTRMSLGLALESGASGKRFARNTRIWSLVIAMASVFLLSGRIPHSGKIFQVSAYLSLHAW